jgi:ankyrin repeat protein
MRGNSADLGRVRFFIQNDPKSHMYAQGSPQLVCNRKDGNGKTPLYLACGQGNLELVKTLLECEADPHQSSVVSIVIYLFLFILFFISGFFIYFGEFLFILGIWRFFA